jgi:chromate reductase, NAD(P)H dehydrogenase (quinone)
MSEIEIGVIAGSLRRESFNRRLAGSVARLAPPHFKFKLLRIDDVPLYNQDEDDSPPAAAQRFKQEVLDSDAILFVTPEYNRSIPGVLKNLLDHGSRPYGKTVWKRKPAGVIGVSEGPLGTAAAQIHLRSILSYFDMPTLGQPEVYLVMGEEMYAVADNYHGHVQQRLQKWMDRYVEWVEQHLKEAAHA